jgi:hypothetical protein
MAFFTYPRIIMRTTKINKSRCQFNELVVHVRTVCSNPNAHLAQYNAV